MSRWWSSLPVSLITLKINSIFLTFLDLTPYCFLLWVPQITFFFPHPVQSFKVFLPWKYFWYFGLTNRSDLRVILLQFPLEYLFHEPEGSLLMYRAHNRDNSFWHKGVFQSFYFSLNSKSCFNFASSPSIHRKELFRSYHCLESPESHTPFISFRSRVKCVTCNTKNFFSFIENSVIFLVLFLIFSYFWHFEKE